MGKMLVNGRADCYWLCSCCSPKQERRAEKKRQKRRDERRWKKDWNL